jgi:putative hydrolase of the HAD superfamily
MSTFAHIETWIFDLDNTLYPASCRLFDQIDRRIGEFVAELLGVPFDEARAIQKHYFQTHGTSLRGLMLEHGVDPTRYMDYVHDIDLSGVPRNLQLGLALAALPGQKLVFTNGSEKHARRLLAHLGIDDHFAGVFDIEAAGWLPKPERRTYEALVARYAIEPRRAVLFEDMARNLEPAHAMGMTTVWVRNDGSHLGWHVEGDGAPHVHHVADDLAAFLLAATAAAGSSA